MFLLADKGGGKNGIIPFLLNARTSTIVTQCKTQIGNKGLDLTIAGWYFQTVVFSRYFLLIETRGVERASQGTVEGLQFLGFFSMEY